MIPMCSILLYSFLGGLHNVDQKARQTNGQAASKTSEETKCKGSRWVFRENPAQWLLIPWVNIEYLSKTSEKADWEWVTMHMNYHFWNMTHHRSFLLWSTNLTFRKVVRPVNSVHMQLANAYCLALLLIIILNQQFAPQEHDTNKSQSGDVS